MRHPVIFTTSTPQKTIDVAHNDLQPYLFSNSGMQHREQASNLKIVHRSAASDFNRNNLINRKQPFESRGKYLTYLAKK